MHPTKLRVTRTSRRYYAQVFTRSYQLNVNGRILGKLRSDIAQVNEKVTSKLQSLPFSIILILLASYVTYTSFASERGINIAPKRMY